MSETAVTRKKRTWITSKITKLIAPRVCLECGDLFTPRVLEQLTCGGACAKARSGRQGIPEKTARLLVVIARRKVEKRAAIERECRRRWPDLTAREIELFTYAHKLGYTRGYQAGLHHQRRQERT